MFSIVHYLGTQWLKFIVQYVLNITKQADQRLRLLRFEFEQLLGRNKESVCISAFFFFLKQNDYKSNFIPYQTKTFS